MEDISDRFTLMIVQNIQHASSACQTCLVVGVLQIVRVYLKIAPRNVNIHLARIFT